MSKLPDFLIIPSQILLDKNLQPLDGYVYGLVYWFSRLKLEKCIASNKEIADRLGASASGVANSLSRLNKYGYVEVILDQYNQRKEIIPTVTYMKVNVEPLLDQVTPLTQTSNPPYSNDEHNNKIKEKDLIIKEKNIIKKENSYPLEAITDSDIQEIAEKYHCTPAFVLLQKEKMINWTEAKGKRYKNYKSALRNWVISSMEKSIEGRLQGNVRPTVDARGLSKRV